jgi:hypothetical protein
MISFRKRPVTIERLQWWGAIVLSTLFGKKVKIEGSDEFVKIFPLVWKGKLHLFGAQNRAMTLRFQWPYTLSLKPSNELAEIGLEDKSVSVGESAIIVICHLASQSSELIMNYFKKISPGSTVILAYGGTIENFENINYDNRFYINDNKIRGVGYRQSYFGMLDDFKKWMRDNSKTFSWITIIDYDCLPLHKDWNEKIITLIRQKKASFGGKSIRDCTGDNSLFICNALNDGILKKLEKNKIFRNISFYQCLGALLCLSMECLDHISTLRDHFEDIFFEVSLPTCAAQGGFKMISLDSFSDVLSNVRFRPVYSHDDVCDLYSNNQVLVHPVKETDQIIHKLNKLR